MINVVKHLPSSPCYKRCRVYYRCVIMARRPYVTIARVMLSFRMAFLVKKKLLTHKAVIAIKSYNGVKLQKLLRVAIFIRYSFRGLHRTGVCGLHRHRPKLKQLQPDWTVSGRTVTGPTFNISQAGPDRTSTGARSGAV